MHLVSIGGSDAGISAALRARELDPAADVTVVVADAYPNFSICGIPYYVSGEVAHWRNLAHRTLADLEAAGMRLRLDTTATDDRRGRDSVSPSAAPTGRRSCIGYDKLVVGTGAVPVRPPIAGLRADLGPDDGVHLLHSMGDTFAVTAPSTSATPARAVIVGAGYIGLEMADALTVRGLAVTQMEQLPEVLPTVDAELGALVHAELDPPRRRGPHRHHRHAHHPQPRRRQAGCTSTPPVPTGRAARPGRRPGPGRRRRPARHRALVAAGARPASRAPIAVDDTHGAPACPTSSPPGTA